MDAIDSVQILHYFTIIFPSTDEVIERENPIELRLVPSRSAEIVFQTRALALGPGDVAVSQLVVQCSFHRSMSKLLH